MLDVQKDSSRPVLISRRMSCVPRTGHSRSRNAQYLLETSLPGVFAAGRCARRENAVKRVASAVGEGSIAIPLVHQLLRE